MKWVYHTRMRTTKLAARPDRATLVAWLVLALFAAVFFYIHASFTQDDAYITYRYARNLSQGMGFVYNANERVLGTSTPLFTVVLAAGTYVSKLDVATVSLLIGLLSLWIGAGTLYLLGQAHSKSLALAAALLYLTNPFLSEFVGMESYLLICLLLLAAWAYAGRRLWLASVLCGLLALVRYEMIILVGILAVLEFRTRRQPPYWLLTGLAPVFVWTLFAWVYFGSPIPLSAQAKLAAPRVPFLLGAALYEYSFLTSFRPAFVIIILLVTGAVAALVMRRLPGRYGTIILFGVVYLCMASTVAGSFPWYYAPLMPTFSIMAAGGIQLVSELTDAICRGWKARHAEQLARWLRWAIIAGVVAIQLVFWRNDYVLQQYQDFDHRYAAYLQASQWLNQSAAPHQTLASLEIGYLGYFTNMTMIDLAGLVTPGLSAWVKDGKDATLAQSLKLYAPDFVLVPSADSQQIAIMSQDPRYQLEREFLDAYRLYAKTARQAVGCAQTPASC